MGEVCYWKVYHIIRALLSSIETENPVALAMSTRSLIEHLASLAVVRSALEELISELEGQNAEKNIDRALRKAESIISRSYYGSSPKAAAAKEKKAIHINDSLNILQKD